MTFRFSIDFLNKFPEFQAKLKDPLKFSGWINELVLQIRNESQYFETGDECLKSVRTEDRECVKDELNRFFHFIISKGLLPTARSNCKESQSRNGALDNLKELLVQTANCRARLMVDLKEIEKRKPVEFFEKTITHEFTVLEDFILKTAITNDLSVKQIQKILVNLGHVHAALKDQWDPKTFVETFKFKICENEKIGQLQEIQYTPSLNNTVCEYRFLIKYISDQKWKLPSLFRPSMKATISQDKKRKKKDIHSLEKISSKKPKIDHIKCYNCDGMGHFAKHCLKSKSSERSQIVEKIESVDYSSVSLVRGKSGSTEKLVFEENFSGMKNVLIDFILDTGNPYRFVADKSVIENYQEAPNSLNDSNN